MGYDRLHAIIVTGYSEGHAERAREQACELATKHGIGEWGAAIVSPMVSPTTSGPQTFLVSPDGGKEGRGTSNEGDAFRAEFVQWLREQSDDSGVGPLAWVEVQYGDDSGITRVVAHSDDFDEDLTTQEPR